MTQMLKNLPVILQTQVQSLGGKDPWRRKWQLSPVFLPGKFYGERSLVGYSPWGHKLLDMTEQLTLYMQWDHGLDCKVKTFWSNENCS